MLDFGWTELAIIAVIALMVIGPKDLPKVLRTMGQWTRACVAWRASSRAISTT